MGRCPWGGVLRILEEEQRRDDHAAPPNTCPLTASPYSVCRSAWQAARGGKDLWKNSAAAGRTAARRTPPMVSPQAYSTPALRPDSWPLLRRTTQRGRLRSGVSRAHRRRAQLCFSCSLLSRSLIGLCHLLELPVRLIKHASSLRCWVPTPQGLKLEPLRQCAAPFHRAE